MLAALFMGYIVVWALLNKDKVPRGRCRHELWQKVYESRHLIPVVSLIAPGAGRHLQRHCHRHRGRGALGVGGALVLAGREGS
jgi:C4-dicarboxylate transporter DctM subunit